MIDKKDILERLDFRAFYEGQIQGFRPAGGDEIKTLCPFHDDSQPSFYANVQNGQFYCQGCGEHGDVFTLYQRLHQMDFKTALEALGKMVGLSNGNGTGEKASKKREQARAVMENCTVRYDYLGQEGNYRFSVLRFEESGKDKTFRQWHYDFQTESWIQNVQGVTLIPYHLNEIANAETVYIVEGEKDVDNLAGLGIVATCNPQGAGKWRDEYSLYLKGKRVVILPDNDEPGRSHAEDVKQKLLSHVAGVRVVALPGLPEKGDVSDWLNQGGTVEELQRIVSQVKEEAPPPPPFYFIGMSDLMQQCSADWLIKGILDRNSLAVLFGEPASMKSFLAIDLCVALAGEDEWHGHPVKENVSCFYIAGEGRQGLARRLLARTMDMGRRIPLFVSSGAMEGTCQESAQNVIEAVKALEKTNGKPGLIVLDTLNRNFGAGDENSTKDMTLFVQNMDRLKNELGCSILIVHHSGLQDSNRARGASALRAALDWEYRLTKQDDTRVFTCTKCKDHEQPEEMYFKPEVVDLPWTDEDGEPLTSCVMQLADAPGRKATKLSGATRIAYEALVECVNRRNKGNPNIEISKTRIPIHEWREQSCLSGISQSENSDSKQKAFKRAAGRLLDLDLVHTTNDFYWVNDDRTNGQEPDMSGHV
ncbi:MAG: AAA family ATPase [Desulfovibrionaceae bacterium]|nr:AAA family ATPase [Desulfovibrionaceae bacterium]